MIRRGEAFGVLVVAVFVAATCAILFAHASAVHAEACGRTHMLVPAKPAADGIGASLTEAASIPADFLGWHRPVAPVSAHVPDRCELGANELFASDRVTRAPPLA